MYSEPDDDWFDAEIVKRMKSGRYKIHWTDDDYSEVVEVENIEPRKKKKKAEAKSSKKGSDKFAKGDKVKVYSEPDDDWFDAEIVRYNAKSDSYRIYWTDDEYEETVAGDNVKGVGGRKKKKKK